MKIASLRSRQGGFTLIEIAIVLVIIGILTVGVLQGQDILENSRTKSVVSDMKALGAAYNSYIDRYQNPPGDETAAAMTARGWTGTLGGDADGVLEISATTPFNTGTTEGGGFWRALRAAGFLSGDSADPASYAAGLPRHRAGGLLGVSAGPVVYGMSGKLFACASGLTSKQAAAIDVAVDGALPDTQIGNNIGNLRAASGAANPLAPTAAVAAGAAYTEATTNPWTVCMKLS